ncbi:MAG: penicillin-binding protein activator [Pseudomonadota bacterium]
MQKNKKNLLAYMAACLAVGASAACSTPCEPGRLCAPLSANTSAVPAAGALATPATGASAGASAMAQRKLGAGADAARAASPAQGAVPAASPGALLKPVAARVALLLPLRSESLGPAAQAVRDGFMAAFERDGEGVKVSLVETGDGVQETLDAYAAAVEQNDIVVGPLARSAVEAVVSSPLVGKPTIVLNRPEQRGGGADLPLPPRMLVIGLSIEDEARQVARWAAAEQSGAALIASGNTAWQRRIATAFSEQWRAGGRHAQALELDMSDGFLNPDSLAQLQEIIDSEHPALLFAALNPLQLRQLRAAIGNGLPVYGTSSINPGLLLVKQNGAGVGSLDGIHVVDLPWELHPEHPAVMSYARRPGSEQSLDLDRLYALGIDAFRVLRAMTLDPAGDFSVDGLTGRLTISFGPGPARFERSESAAVLRGGAFVPVQQGR